MTTPASKAAALHPDPHRAQRATDAAAPRSPTAAEPTAPPRDRTASARLDAILGSAARILGFGAVLGALAFAAWGWALSFLR